MSERESKEKKIEASVREKKPSKEKKKQGTLRNPSLSKVSEP